MKLAADDTPADSEKKECRGEIEQAGAAPIA